MRPTVRRRSIQSAISFFVSNGFHIGDGKSASGNFQTVCNHCDGMLRDRKVVSISELAETEQLPRTYVGSVIPFAFLAPDITEAILSGMQLIDLNLDRLINATLPLDWAEHRTLPGFN